MLCKRLGSIVFIEQTLLYFKVARLRLKRGTMGAAVKFACLNEAAQEFCVFENQAVPSRGSIRLFPFSRLR
jgi:hypothetical protein